MNVEPTLPLETSLGPTLRALRESRQVELAAVSARLKFSVQQLQALEDEDWTRLPTGLTLRGMVKNYGRFLETDAAALLTLLDVQTGASTKGAAHVATPASLGDAQGTSHHVRYGGWLWVWMLLIVAVLFVAGVYAVERGWISGSWLAFD